MDPLRCLARLALGALAFLSLSNATAHAKAVEAPSASVERAAWIETYAVKHETAAVLAERYGVAEEDIIRWNSLVADEDGRYVHSGARLRIRARAFPSPRQRARHRVREDETLESIAERYGVRADELLIWNPWLVQGDKPRRLRAKMQLTIWAPSSVAGPGGATRGPAIPEFSVPPDQPVATSRGRPHKGRLIDGAALPVNESLYTIRFERLAFGTTLAVLNIQRALASFRYETAYPGTIYIGAMSRKTGRRLRPHKSHQSGRDVDVRLPAMPYATRTQKLREWEVDWHATWALIRAFAETGEVQQIFLEMKFWRRLRKAAVEMGTPDAEIASIMRTYVRHSRGHVAHIHVRFVCSEAAEYCRD